MQFSEVSSVTNFFFLIQLTRKMIPKTFKANVLIAIRAITPTSKGDTLPLFIIGSTYITDVPNRL